MEKDMNIDITKQYVLARQTTNSKVILGSYNSMVVAKDALDYSKQRVADADYAIINRQESSWDELS